MSQRVFVMHAVSVLVACCLLVYLYLFPLQIGHAKVSHLVSRTLMSAFAGLGACTGFWLMAKRQGKSESLVLAMSTLVAVLLLIISLGPEFVV
jgi:hypothetical protein